MMEYGFSSMAVDHEDHDNSPANREDSPSSGMSSDTKAISSSSRKRSRRSLQKRVVSVPIKEIEGSGAPSSDSWAWRKYGQKPIKGSPYPRGYYRCSSSKGCPARKQVERSRVDPTMVMVTYSCDHNHTSPASRKNNHNSTVSPPPVAEEMNSHDQEEDPPLVTKELIAEPKEKFTSLEVCPSGASFVTTTDQFTWFSNLESPSSTMLESPLMVGDIVEDADMAMIFSIREEDESLFADLGELPECPIVFRREEIINYDKHHRRPCNLATWCGTKG